MKYIYVERVFRRDFNLKYTSLTKDLIKESQLGKLNATIAVFIV